MTQNHAARPVIDARVYPPLITTATAEVAIRPRAHLVLPEPPAPARAPVKSRSRWKVAIAATAGGVSAMAVMFAVGLWFATTVAGHAVAIILVGAAVVVVVLSAVAAFGRDSVTVTGFSLRVKR